MQTHTDAPPFRDASHGVTAKREQLLGDRRADLAYMSHEIRRIYVGRSGRVGMSLALALGGSALLAALLSNDVADLVTSALPGASPAPLANLLLATWLLAIAGSLLGRAIGERRFTVAMSRAVLPSQDAHRDVARLSHERPEEVGQRMAHRMGRKRQPLAALATGLVLPASALITLLAFESGGYADLAIFEELLIQTTMLSCGFAIVAALYGATLHRYSKRATMALGVASIGLAYVLTNELWLYLAAGTCTLRIQAWLIAQKHEREEAVLGERGTPLPKPLHIRKRLRSALGRIAAVARQLRGLNRQRTIAVTAAICALALPLALLSASPTSDQPVASASAAQVPVVAVTNTVPTPKPDANVGSVALLESGGGITVKLNFEADGELSATSYLDGASIPPGWRAVVSATKIDSSGALYLTFFGDAANEAPRLLGYDAGVVTSTHTNCSDRAIPLELTAEPYGQHELSTSVALRYSATLEFVGSCFD